MRVDRHDSLRSIHFSLMDGSELIASMDVILFGKREVNIDDIYVGEECRGQGLSKILYHALKSWCVEKGVRSVHGCIIHPAALKNRIKVFGPPSVCKEEMVLDYPEDESRGPIGEKPIWHVTHNLG